MPDRLCLGFASLPSSFEGEEKGEEGKVEEGEKENRFRLGNCFLSITVAIPRVIPSLRSGDLHA